MPSSRYARQLRPKIWSRADWGAHPPRSVPPPLGKVKAITIHHTVSAERQPFEEIRIIQGYHMHKEPDPFIDIGYHYLVDRDGRVDGIDVYDGREKQPTGELSLGAHTAGHNTGNIGVAVLGDYSREQFTPAQRKSLEDLLAWLCYEYDLPVSAISGHRDYSKTECPGDHLYAQLESIRQDLLKRLVPPVEKPTYPEVNLIINGRTLRTDPPAVLVEGVTIVPLRPVIEAMGDSIYWDAETNTVYIESRP